MDQVPAFVSVVFMVTTFITVGIFLYAVRRSGAKTLAARLVLFIVPFWLIFQFVVGAGGFYQDTASLPPRMFVFGVAPALLLILGLFVFARSSFILALPITWLTIIHVVRIPVELTLAWLADAQTVPEVDDVSRDKSGYYFGAYGTACVLFRDQNDTGQPRSLDRLEPGCPRPCSEYSYHRDSLRPVSDPKARLRSAEHRGPLFSVLLAADGHCPDRLIFPPCVPLQAAYSPTGLNIANLFAYHHLNDV